MDRKSKVGARIISTVVVLASLSACAPPPPLSFALNGVSRSPTVLDYTLRSTVVTLASPSERTGPMPGDSSIAVPIWRAALEDAMDRSAVFEDPALHVASLECKILKIDTPSVGLAMTTDVAARYQIIDSSNGNILFDKLIDTKGTVPVGYNFLGYIRARESINVAAQNNIAKFLSDLESSQLVAPRQNFGGMPVD